MAGLLLGAIASAEERRATEATITRFKLDRTRAADVMAAQAYV